MATTSSRVEVMKQWLSNRATKAVVEALRHHWVDYGFMLAFVVLIAITASESDIFLQTGILRIY
jgi:hypothetical protein